MDFLRDHQSLIPGEDFSLTRQLVTVGSIAVIRTALKFSAVNIPAPYHPDYKAFDYPEISRPITREEFLEAMKAAEDCGLTNLDPQSVAIRDRFLLLKEGEPSPVILKKFMYV